MVRFLTFLCLSAALVVACTTRTQSAATRLHDDIATAKPAAVVKADKQLVIVDERLEARASLLHTAVAAIAIVSLCLAAAAYFPLIGGFMRVLAAAAGGFAATVMALRSVLAVPDWVVVSVLVAAGVVAALRLVLHTHALSSALHNIVAVVRPEAAVLSAKAKALVTRIRSKQ